MLSHSESFASDTMRGELSVKHTIMLLVRLVGEGKIGCHQDGTHRADE